MAQNNNGYGSRALLVARLVGGRFHAAYPFSGTGPRGNIGIIAPGMLYSDAFVSVHEDVPHFWKGQGR